ncbi:PREDICTED: uncharacterized protein LOC109241849 [Nicotiana attenuata]|uniref:uncharacterized protein LOC109241849 n=1 Tax=Nicotiana attenuata TaxID=49451 RepID=UPI000904C6DE|nr:PREDICTED: uncharacterized protein LOC109241849 [Nicotiana attenuata]
MALVSWEVLCRPKKYGELNIKGCKSWNIASVGKLLWQLVTNKEVLWVRWVHGVYMKSCRSIWDHRPPSDCSWYWKKLNSLKQNMAQWYHGSTYRLTSNWQYSVSSNYNAMLGQLSRCREMELVWSRTLLPRHRFVLWLAFQQKMQTKSRLVQMNIPITGNAECCLCDLGVIETRQHLFRDCSWFKNMRDALTSWAAIRLPNMAVPKMLQWIKRRHWKNKEEGCNSNHRSNGIPHLASEELENFQTN